MKPQSLQEAIKAQALARAQKRQKGEWKEPIIKQHKVTAEDLVAASRKGPAATAPMIAMANPICNAEVTAISNLINVKLLPLMEEMSIETKILKKDNTEIRELLQKTSVVSNREESCDIELLKSLKTQLEEANVDICELKALIESHAEKADKEISELKKLIKAQAGNLPTAPLSPSPTTKFYSLPESPIKSPSKKPKPPSSLEPHSAKDLLEAQRKDKVLRLFMKTKEGLYDPKYMSLREVPNVGNIVMFKRKIYIPEILRAETIAHYKKMHDTDSQALEMMRKNTCWPDLEKDFFGVVDQ